jgi:hypothetical protein
MQTGFSIESRIILKFNKINNLAARYDIISAGDEDVEAV